MDKITILMPCKDQKEEFLLASLHSVIHQTSPNWMLLVIIDCHTPEKIKHIISSFTSDPRIRILVCEKQSFAAALNTGMAHARTEFTCILFSDDLLDKKAIATLQRYIQKYPHVDFFHSSRRYVDAHGRKRGTIMRSKTRFTLAYFRKRGSPIKHLLCWRREKGLAIGGIDEELTLHGADDYDFPWRMAESGCRFKAIKECLYYYRVHHDFYRLTTHVPIDRQLAIIRKTCGKHNVPETDIDRHIARISKGYIIRDKLLKYEKERMDLLSLSSGRVVPEERIDLFLSKGWKKSLVTPHAVYYIPRPGHEGLKLSQRMCGVNDPNMVWEILLYAGQPIIGKFPEKLFFDRELIWHQRHLGKSGHIAYALVVFKKNNLYGLNYVSDIVQRISRKREYKTKVENTFRGWTYMLMNSILSLAVEKKIKKFYSPNADLVMANTDPKRRLTLKRELFDRIYNRLLYKNYEVACLGDWWAVDVEKNMKKIACLPKQTAVIEHGKTICICHDIEKGFGHLDVHPEFAKQVNITSVAALEEMLRIEKEAGVKATYNVLGCLLAELRESIESKGHCVAFHSYDHKDKEQVAKCRQIDKRIRGYRPARSRITAELNERNLLYYNFDWVASSARSLNLTFPRMQNGIVKIPISVDDFKLYCHRIDYPAWEERAIDMIKQNDFVALGLHDCYASQWLPHYRAFLEKIRKLGNVKTFDEVANEIILANAQ